MSITSMKFCSRKKHHVPRTEFNSHQYTRDGLQQWCRQCESEYRKQRLLALKTSV